MDIKYNSMHVRIGDIEAINKALVLAMMDLKADTVMVPKTGIVSLSSMYYHGSASGWREILSVEPDISHFEAVDAATLFSLLHSIELRRVPGRPVIKSGFTRRGLIDLSSMLEDMNIVADIHFAMKQLRPILVVGKRAGHEDVIADAIEGVKADLMALCKDDYGVTEAKRLWATYEPLLGRLAPDLAVRLSARQSAAPEGTDVGLENKEKEHKRNVKDNDGQRGRNRQ